MLIYLIAGEPSGDLLGARLMAGLKELTGGQVRFAGIGGANMRAEGLEPLFPMADLTVMGLVEVLPRLPLIMKRLRQTMDHIASLSPDALVTIDSWGFTGRIQTQCQQRLPDLPRIHYVAPMVWAWKPQRAAKLARVLDLLMTLLPFEPPWFEKEGLRTVHVGHPVIEGQAGQGDANGFRRRHGLAEDRPLLVVLPGSRRSETAMLLPIFRDAVAILAKTHPQLQVVVPTVETVADHVRAQVRHWALPAMVVEGAEEKYAAFAAGTAALAASGTVALELAMAGLPAAIAYRVSAVTAFIARKFMGFRIKWATLVNMVLDRSVMEEFLQEDCQSAALAAAITRLLDDPALRAAKQAQMADAMALLGQGGASPSRRAAQTVLDYVAERKNR